MQQQLFLFEAPDSKMPDAAAQQPGVAGNKEPAANLPAEETPAPASREEQPVATAIADPFAAVRQEQEEKLENMLLLPAVKRGRKSFRDMDAETILVEVPDDEVLFQKQYYSMRTVAGWFGITLSQLRKWEIEFDILQPKKNVRGDRFFRPEDVKNLQLIYHLIRRRKFTTAGAIQYLKENKKNLRKTIQLTDALAKLKQFLLELRAISE